MKQLDFFFDFFSQQKNKFFPDNAVSGSGFKTLVAGGRSGLKEVLVVHGRRIRVRRKAYQRHLSLRVRPNGDVSVTAARTIPLKMVQKFVFDSQVWIEGQVQKYQELRALYPKKQFVEGEYFPIQGLNYCLKTVQSDAKKPVVKIEGDHLIVEMPEKFFLNPEILSSVVKAVVRHYYEEHGKKLLSERLFLNSQRTQLYPQSVSYRCQKTRWGSCSSSGHISLNWKLVAAPLEVIDYVIVHELCHLEHANHSRSFWKLVEKHSPKWKKLRRWLADNQYNFDFLSDPSELYPENDNMIE